MIKSLSIANIANKNITSDAITYNSYNSQLTWFVFNAGLNNMNHIWRLLNISIISVFSLSEKLNLTQTIQTNIPEKLNLKSFISIIIKLKTTPTNLKLLLFVLPFSLPKIITKIVFRPFINGFPKTFL